MKKLMILFALMVGMMMLCSDSVMAAPNDPICKDPDATAAQREKAGCIDINVDLPKGNDSNLLPTLLGAAYAIIGVVAVVIIIVSGIQYITSAGEPEKVKRAKDTIVYTVVGLIIATLAATIIGFVTGAFA